MAGGKLRKIIGWTALASGILAGVYIFGFAPKLTEESMNVVEDRPLLKITDEARKLHESLVIVDLHSDSLLWKRNITNRADRGHMDIPRLQDGNVAIQIFSSVTKTPKGQNYDSNSGDTDNITPLVIAQLQPMRTWSSLLERSLYHAQKLQEAEAANQATLSMVTRAQDIAKIVKSRRGDQKITGAIFSVEGLHNLEGKRENLGKLYNAGMRMAGLTHFFDNKLAGSMHGEKKTGLTEFGRDVVRDMEEMGIIVDIAHCSKQCVADVLSMARRPVVSSHGGVQATCDVNRNLTDEEIKGVAAVGGVIGVGYWPGAVCDTDPKSIAKAMKHIRDLVGIEHVALGSDYDGAVTVGFDTSQLVQVTQALLNAGFSEEEIRAAMGGNALSVITSGLVPMASQAEEAAAE